MRCEFRPRADLFLMSARSCCARSLRRLGLEALGIGPRLGQFLVQFCLGEGEARSELLLLQGHPVDLIANGVQRIACRPEASRRWLLA